MDFAVGVVAVTIIIGKCLCSVSYSTSRRPFHINIRDCASVKFTAILFHTYSYHFMQKLTVK